MVKIKLLECGNTKWCKVVTCQESTEGRVGSPGSGERHKDTAYTGNAQPQVNHGQ